MTVHLIKRENKYEILIVVKFAILCYDFAAKEEIECTGTVIPGTVIPAPSPL